MASRLLLACTILLPLVFYWEGVWVKGEGLHVTITVDYIAPPDASGLGPNDYWAASGPINVTCFAAGSTGTVTYQWSSNCRLCRFGSNPTNQSVTVPVLSSGLTGNATCMAMDATGSTNCSSTELVVVGAGLSISPNNSYIRNNSLTISSNSASIICYSGSVAEENVGSFVGVDGSVIHAVAHPKRGSVSLSLQEADTPGIYTCAIPDENKRMREVNFGVYPIGFNTPPSIGTDDLVFSNGSFSSTLTCTSTGSPATTVAWLKDGQPLSIGGSTYQLTQAVANRAESTYENVLTINDKLANIIDHNYTCRVNNILGSASRDIYVGDSPSPQPIPTTASPPAPEPTGPHKTDHVTAIAVGIGVGVSLVAIVCIVAVTVCCTLKRRKPGNTYRVIQPRRNTKINERSTERSTFANERSTFANERSTFVNECSTFVSSGSDPSDEPIYDVPVVCHYNYNADGHHRGYNAQAPVGHENDVEQRQRYEQVHSHEPSVPTRREHGYGSMQSSDYETQRPVYAQIYHHEEDSGRYHEVQHS